MQAFRADGGVQWAEIGLARPSAAPDRIRPLLAMKIPDFDAGFGFDCLRIEALCDRAGAPRAASRPSRRRAGRAGAAGRRYRAGWT